MSRAANSDSELPGIISLWDIVNMESQVVADNLSHWSVIRANVNEYGLLFPKCGENRRQTETTCMEKTRVMSEEKLVLSLFFLWNQCV